MRNPRARTRRREPVATHKMHITRGDRVRVIRGDDAGTEGTVLRVIPKMNRVVIEGVNMVTKHKRATQNDEGGTIHFPASIHVSNVMLLDPKTSDPTRVKRQKDKDGTVERLKELPYHSVW